MSFPRLTSTLLATLLLLAIVAGPAAAVAQVDAPTPANETDTGVGIGAASAAEDAAGNANRTDHWLGNGSGGDVGAGGGGGGGLFGSVGAFGSWFGGVLTALSNPLETFQGYAEQLIHLLVERPVPTTGDGPAWFERPQGDIMGAVWDVTWDTTVPAAVLLTALYVGLAAGMHGILPPSVVPKRQSRGAQWQALGKLVHVILGWTIMVAWAVICRGIAQWLAPTGTQIFPGGQSALEQVGAATFMGILLWLSSGVLAFLAIIVWALSWAGAVFAPVAYPLFIAARPPNLPLLRKLRMLPDTGVLFALIAVPVPTGLILGGGYPIINGIRGATSGPIASLGGVPLTILLTLVMWFLALIAPILMVASARSMRPAAMFAAGALGAVAGASVRGRGPGLPSPGLGGSGSGGAGAAAASDGGSVSPLAGSSSTPGGGGMAGGGLGASADGGAAGALGAGGGAPVGGGMGGGPPTTGAAGGGGSTSAGASPDANLGETSRTVSATDLPPGQQYEVGFETSQGWQVIEDTTFDRDFLTDEGGRAIERMESATSEDLYARGVQDSETYNIQTGDK